MALLDQPGRRLPEESRGPIKPGGPDLAGSSGLGIEDLDVVWMDHCPAAFESMFASAGRPLGGVLMRNAVLLPEGTNGDDANAVAVLIDGLHVGYVPPPDAARIQPIALECQRQGKPLDVLAGVRACGGEGGWIGRVTLSFSGSAWREWSYVDRPTGPYWGSPDCTNRLTGEAQRRLWAESGAAGHIRGRDFESLRADLAQARADHDSDLALRILDECIPAAERRAAVWLQSPVTWPTEQTAVIFRSLKDYDREVAVLERYADACPEGAVIRKVIRQRLAKARTLSAKSHGLVEPDPFESGDGPSVHENSLPEPAWYRLSPDPFAPITVVDLPVAAEVVRKRGFEAAIRAVYTEAGIRLGTPYETTAVLQQHTREPHGLTATAAYVHERLVGYVGAAYSWPVQEATVRALNAGATAAVRCRLYASEHSKWTTRITLGPYEDVVSSDDDTQADAERRANAEVQALQRLDRLASGGEVAKEQRKRLVRHKDVSEWVEPIKQLKREGRHQEALGVLTECIDATEREALRYGRCPPPWYTEQATMVLRKLKDSVGEIAVLERYITACPPGRESPDMEERLVKARARKARN